MKFIPSWLANRGLSRLPLVERIADRFYKREAIETIYGHKMKLDPQDSMNLSRWGFYEKEETERIQKIIQPGQCVVDVGANIGYYSLVLAAGVTHTGTVYAYEPHPENNVLLMHNIHLNNLEKQTVIRDVACSSITGWMYLHLSSISSGMHTVEELMLERDTYQTTHTLEVRTVILDMDLPKGLPVHFMKIDVEGHELEVLKGAEILLRLNHPILMVEYSASPKVIPFLEVLDYVIDIVNEKNLFAFPNTPSDDIPRDRSSLAEA